LRHALGGFFLDTLFQGFVERVQRHCHLLAFGDVEKRHYNPTAALPSLQRGDVTYSTGKLDPSLRQKRSSLTRCMILFCIDRRTGQSSMERGLPSAVVWWIRDGSPLPINSSRPEAQHAQAVSLNKHDLAIDICAENALCRRVEYQFVKVAQLVQIGKGLLRCLKGIPVAGAVLPNGRL